jgi:membrane-associated phospholipid phosphatase
MRAAIWRRQLARLREARAIVFLAGLFVGFLLLSFLARSPALLHVDRQFTRELQEYRPGWLVQIASGLTFLGNATTLVSLALFAIGACVWSARPWAAVLCALSLAGVPLNWWIKPWIGRPRPEEGMIHVLLPAVGLSFPSGHAMASVMFYGFLALLAWVHLSPRAPRLFWTVAFAAVALGVSISRIYLGAHWFSDVVGGWTAGLFFLFLLAELYKWAAPAELGGEVKPRPPGNRLAAERVDT